MEPEIDVRTYVLLGLFLNAGRESRDGRRVRHWQPVNDGLAAIEAARGAREADRFERWLFEQAQRLYDAA